MKGLRASLEFVDEWTNGIYQFNEEDLKLARFSMNWRSRYHCDGLTQLGGLTPAQRRRVKKRLNRMKKTHISQG